MFRTQIVGLALVAALGGTGIAFGAEFSGDRAFAYTKAAVDFGPRPSGSEAIGKLQAYILAELKSCGCEVTQDDFTAKTPRGGVKMKNIIARFKGTGGTRAIAVTGHYDTKYFTGRHFVGASDGGSSTGVLLEMAHVFAGAKHKDDWYIVFFDGEEAVGEWSDTDKLYGSRHLAARWQADKTLAKLRAVINVDMVGDRDLNLMKEPNSTRGLTELVWGVARDLGYRENFLDRELSLDDDHMPFLEAGVAAVDLIDFDYAPWHEDTDTLDKLSPKSLEIVGRVVVAAVKQIEAR